MRRINVVCPICSKFKRLPVPREIFEIDEGYLLKLPIEKGTICDHEFLVVLDYNFSIRDYEIPQERNDFLKKYFSRDKSSCPPVDFSFFWSHTNCLSLSKNQSLFYWRFVWINSCFDWFCHWTTISSQRG